MPTHVCNDAIPVTADTEAVVDLLKQLDDCKTAIDLSSCLRVHSIGKSGFRFEKSKTGFPNRTRNPKTGLTGSFKVL